MTGPRITLDGEWLVEQVDHHTCGAGGEWGHEPGCGLVPLMTLAELDELLTALGKLKAPINRPAEVIAAAGRQGEAKALRYAAAQVREQHGTASLTAKHLDALADAASQP